MFSCISSVVVTNSAFVSLMQINSVLAEMSKEQGAGKSRSSGTSGSMNNNSNDRSSCSNSDNCSSSNDANGGKGGNIGDECGSRSHNVSCSDGESGSTKNVIISTIIFFIICIMRPMQKK